MALKQPWQLEDTETEVQAAAGKRKRHREWSGAVAVLTLGLAGLIASKLGLLWPRFDIFAQFTIQFAIFVISGAVGLFSPRLKGVTAGLVAVLLLTGYGLWPSFNFQTTESSLASAEKRLKVAQFNLGGERSSTQAVLDSLHTINADIVTLVETGTNGGIILAKLKTDYPFQVNCFESSGCDMAVVSKLPLSNSKVIYAGQSVPILKASLGAGYRELIVAAIHTTRFPHITEQFVQFRAIAQALEVDASPLLLMGDFNATPQSRVLQGLADRLGLSIVTYLPSWPATYGLPQLAIDHILISSSLRALSPETAGQSAGSDHLPIARVLGVATGAQ